MGLFTAQPDERTKLRPYGAIVLVGAQTETSICNEAPLLVAAFYSGHDGGELFARWALGGSCTECALAASVQL